MTPSEGDAPVPESDIVARLQTLADDGPPMRYGPADVVWAGQRRAARRRVVWAGCTAFAIAGVVALAVAVVPPSGRDVVQVQEAGAPAPPVAADARRFIAMIGYPMEIETVVDSPRELRELVDVVVEGTITDVVDHHVVGGPGEKPRSHFMLKIKPIRFYKSPVANAPDEALIDLLRPADAAPGELREAIANGTRVFLFGYQRNSATKHLYGPDPQGLFIEVDGRAVPALAGNQMSDSFRELDTMERIASGLSPVGN
jgi:hypothetical protein